jgi:hypothetical protein
VAQQILLGGKAARKARERAVRTQHAMARRDDRDRVAAPTARAALDRPIWRAMSA